MSNDGSTNAAQPLSAGETRTLRCVAGIMIPPSAEYHVPGADNELIFADIASTLGRDTAAVSRALQRLDALSSAGFADLAHEAQLAALTEFASRHAFFMSMLSTVVVRCYYRDDRVMQSLNMEVRPPFPKGFEVEQGDWSLLDPVRARGRIYRDVP